MTDKNILLDRILEKLDGMEYHNSHLIQHSPPDIPEKTSIHEIINSTTVILTFVVGIIVALLGTYINTQDKISLLKSELIQANKMFNRYEQEAQRIHFESTKDIEDFKKDIDDLIDKVYNLRNRVSLLENKDRTQYPSR